MTFLSWPRIAAGLVVLALVAAPAVWAWRTRDRIANLEAQLAEKTHQLDGADARLVARQAALDACNASAAQTKADADAYKARLDLELAKPPRVVVRYRETLPPAPAITSPDCPTAVAELLAYVRDLATAEREDPTQ